MSIFSENLKTLLHIRGMTQRQFAQELDLNIASVSRYCSGEQMPRIDVLQKISDYFNISKSDLLDIPLNKSDDVVYPRPSSYQSLFMPYDDNALTATIIQMLPQLKIKELKSIKQYMDYLIHQKIYTEDIDSSKDTISKEE